MAEKPDSRPEGSGRNPREHGTGASNVTARRANSEPEEMQLMEAVVERENLLVALKRVEANRGSAGIDEMSVEDLRPYLKEHWPRIKEELLEDRYQPRPVRKVDIPKSGVGVRTLGIPTVVDRLIQQALHQVLTPIFDGDFSTSSYGFRPGRSAHEAVLQARAYVAKGRRWVVDIDLEEFFDRVNHDILMSRVARKVKDKRILRLIRRYLQTGTMTGGLVSARHQGTPQGGPLSPLLSNILLDELDKELERRLKLRVNRAKSAVDRPWKRKFLGYSLTGHREPRLKVAASSVKRLKGKLKQAFRRGRGRNLRRFIEELKPLLRGWMQYFRLAEVKGVFEELDGWIRRRLRCLIWRQWKRTLTRAKNLMRRGLTKDRALKSAMNGRGPWWNAGASHMHAAFSKAYFGRLGLVSLLTEHHRFQCAS